MTVLVVGAGGQVGRALLETAPADREVEGVGRERMDLDDPASLPSVLEAIAPRTVVNAAGFTAVDRAEDEPESATRVNAEAPGVMARWCADHGARFIHLSTDFVFDGRISRPLTPADEPRPLGVYGRTKRDGELRTLGAGGGAVVLRTAWVYARAGRNFVLAMLERMRSGTAVDVVVDQVGSPTHAASLAGALWRLVEVPRIAGVHHWTDAGVASRYDLAVAVMEEALALGLLDREVSIRPVRTDAFPTRAERPAYSALDSTSTVDALGIRPHHWRRELRTMLGGLARCTES